MFQKFPWLVFSRSQKGLYCRYCPLFLPNLKAGGVSLQKLVTKPVTDFRKLLGKDGCLIQHANHLYHKQAVEAGKEFLLRIQSPHLSVINQQDKAHLKKVEENRKMLTSIVKCVLFLGKQNIPFRGHRDDGNIVQEDQSSINEGNFRELVRFRIESGDKQLEKHLTSACANAMYSSKTIQNELVNFCGNNIKQIILDRIKSAKYYSIMFDETTDAAHESQLTFVLRYIHEGNIYEDFLEFVDPRKPEEADEGENHIFTQDELEEPSLTGEMVANTVLNIMKKNGLDVENCVGISTDGCSSMVSEIKGAVSFVKRNAINATHCPCLSHALNLSLTKTSNVQEIRNAVDTIKTVISFFAASPKRNCVLKEKVGRQLIGLCTARWVERHDSVHLFFSTLPKVHEALEQVSNWRETEAATKALSLMHCITNSSFLVSLASLADVLAVTFPLSRLLQKKELDGKEANEAVKLACANLEKRRNESEEYFHSVFEVVQGLASELETEIIIPRVTIKQKNRSNPTNIKDPEIFYRVIVYNTLVDNILQDIQDRLPPDTVSLYELTNLIPSSVIKITNPGLKDLSSFIFSKFNFALENTSKLSLPVLLNEIAIWQTKWTQQKEAGHDIPDVSIESLLACDKEVYPSVYNLLQIFSSLPVSSATAERSFSTLRRLKDWMRTTMREDRLVSLALMNVHREIADKIDPNKIVDLFAKQKRRKLDFVV